MLMLVECSFASLMTAVDLGFHPLGPKISSLLQGLPWFIHFNVYILAFLYFIVSAARISSRERSRVASRPPLNAQFLFYLFMTPQNCDALVGDLVERYKLIHKKFGRRRANFWYWTQTAMSLGPIVWAWAKRVVMKPVLALLGWAVAKGLVGHDSWLAAVVELWRRVTIRRVRQRHLSVPNRREMAS
jgi:hypothetical protein